MPKDFICGNIDEIVHRSKPIDGLTVQDIDSEGGEGEATPPPKSKLTRKRKDRREEKEEEKEEEEEEKTAATERIRRVKRAEYMYEDIF